MNDWRWTIAKLMFLVIPVVGIWNWAKYYRIEGFEKTVQVESLADHVTQELRRVRFDFAPEELANVKILCDQSAIAFSDDRQAAVLFRRAGKGLLPACFALGSVSGLVNSHRLVSVDWLNVQGCDLPEDFGPVLWVDVERSYLPSILALTWVFMFLGAIVLFCFYQMLDDIRFDKQKCRNRVEAEVALQLSIARHETYQW